MAIYFYSDTTTIDLDPIVRGYTARDGISKFERSSISGAQYFKIYGDWIQHYMPFSYVPYSDGLQFNEWYRGQTNLTLHFEGAESTIRLGGALPPFTTIERPYTDLWKGSLQIEELS
jgi:hypothetical protein